MHASLFHLGQPRYLHMRKAKQSRPTPSYTHRMTGKGAELGGSLAVYTTQSLSLKDFNSNIIVVF